MARLPTRTPTLDPIVEWQRAVLDELRAIRVALEQPRRSAGGARDAADVLLLTRIASTSAGLAFTAAAVWRRRLAGDVALDEALTRADVDNPQQLGKLLKRLAGRDVGGVVLERLDDNREGAVWRARVRE